MRVDHHFDAPVLLVAESFVGLRSLFKPDPVSDQKGWIDLTISIRSISGSR